MLQTIMGIKEYLTTNNVLYNMIVIQPENKANLMEHKIAYGKVSREALGNPQKSNAQSVPSNNNG